jgi:hypothetical protein
MTFGQPHFRKIFLEQPKYEWNMNYIPVGDTFHYYFYFLKKGESRRVKSKDSVQIEQLQPFHEKMEDENYLLEIHLDQG